MLKVFFFVQEHKWQRDDFYGADIHTYTFYGDKKVISKKLSWHSNRTIILISVDMEWSSSILWKRRYAIGWTENWSWKRFCIGEAEHWIFIWQCCPIQNHLDRRLKIGKLGQVDLDQKWRANQIWNPMGAQRIFQQTWGRILHEFDEVYRWKWSHQIWL